MKGRQKKSESWEKPTIKTLKFKETYGTSGQTTETGTLGPIVS